MSEKPLHVQVAEALGWTEAQSWEDSGPWIGRPPGPLVVGFEDPPIPRYDTSWAWTGPLIEKYLIQTHPQGVGDGWMAWEFREKDRFSSKPPDPPYLKGEGPTPLIAVCRLILALKATGKLEP